MTSQSKIFRWLGSGLEFEVACSRLGSGPQVLCLPAMSTVSSRGEWEAVAVALSSSFAVTLVDWPGFGASSRFKAAYSPAFYDAFLRDFVRAEFSGPVAVVAAGHAAGYVLRLAAAGESLWSRAVLAAPTWRGPLPTAMGKHPTIYGILRKLVEMPCLGHALYRVNTTDWFLRRMFGRHVFAEQSCLTPALVAEKQRLARQRGGRFAAAAFVTGALDPFLEREACLKALRDAMVPVLLVIGEETPQKSREEMEALAGARSRVPLRLPGALGLHEECAASLIQPLREFLDGNPNLGQPEPRRAT